MKNGETWSGKMNKISCYLNGTWIDFWKVEILIRFGEETRKQDKLSHEGRNIQGLI